MNTLAAYAAITAPGWLFLGVTLFGAYLIGSIPWAYVIVRLVTGEDVTAHGTGNVGAMNVRRSTGSWGWFVVAMLSDVLKGLLPVLAARFGAAAVQHAGVRLGGPAFATYLAPQAALLGAVVGHNYSLWMALLKHRFVRTGKGLATGAGGLLAYNPIYFAVVLVLGLSVIAITRYMMAGQVAAAVSLPLFALLARQPDWPFCLFMGGFVYAAHHRRFIGLLQGREPKLYVDDGTGPRG